MGFSADQGRHPGSARRKLSCADSVLHALLAEAVLGCTGELFLFAGDIALSGRIFLALFQERSFGGTGQLFLSCIGGAGGVLSEGRTSEAQNGDHDKFLEHECSW